MPSPISKNTHTEINWQSQIVQHWSCPLPRGLPVLDKLSVGRNRLGNAMVQGGMKECVPHVP